jgi:hypothetical protein
MPSPESIQLTATGISGAFDEVALAADFSERHYLRLPQLLAPTLLARVQRQMQAGPWTPRTHEGIGHEVTLGDPIALHLLTFLVNRPDFLRLVERISGCAPLTNFNGRVYRMLPNSDHYDSWHDDIVPDEDRRVGLSINLGEMPYDGGVFRLRDRKTREILAEVPNLVPGDARIFAIRPGLQHMVTPVTGNYPKTAFAGWFRGTGEGFLDAVLQSGKR